ncbi:COMM domain-containing protein 2 isoform X2 [Sparus aurata]|uniref:COMM domain-containing protein 2 isoform X2 n=1 Tax=Sparus aurata TaxID=8175 RepID=UPI0011C130EE|nr:COMM domain-containing protein 2 isoform X2 [Sparus aurata]
MLLVLSEDHKEHLAFLPKVDTAVVGEFGRIALEFLRRGTSPKIYEGAARKLCVPVEMVHHGVEGLMFLMTESSKHMMSEVDFLDSVLVLGFSEELNQILLQCVRVFVAAVPAAPQSDPQYLESAAFQPAFLSQSGMETGCTVGESISPGAGHSHAHDASAPDERL